MVSKLGLAGLAIERRFITVLSVVAYVGELTLVPWIYHWPRYLAGIAPLLALAFVTGLVCLAGVARRRAHRTSAAPSLAVRLPRAAAIGIGGLVVLFQGYMLMDRFAREHTDVVHEEWNGAPVAYRLFSIAALLALSLAIAA